MPSYGYHGTGPTGSRSGRPNSSTQIQTDRYLVNTQGFSEPRPPASPLDSSRDATYIDLCDRQQPVHVSELRFNPRGLLPGFRLLFWSSLELRLRVFWGIARHLPGRCPVPINLAKGRGRKSTPYVSYEYNSRQGQPLTSLPMVGGRYDWTHYCRPTALLSDVE